MDAIRNSALQYNPSLNAGETGSTDSATTGSGNTASASTAQGLLQSPTDSVGQFQHPGGKFSFEERHLGNVPGAASGKTQGAKETSATQTNWGDTAPGSEPLLNTIAAHLEARAPNYGKSSSAIDDGITWNDGSSGQGGGGQVGGNYGGGGYDNYDGGDGQVDGNYGGGGDDYDNYDGGDGEVGEDYDGGDNYDNYDGGDGQVDGNYDGGDDYDNYDGGDGDVGEDYDDGDVGENEDIAYDGTEPEETDDIVGNQNEQYTTASAGTSEVFSANGPQMNDVQQGDAGDCYFLSSLASVAAQNPDLIKNNIQPAGTDSSSGANVYNVTLYYQGKPETVQVDDSFITNQKGQAAYAQLSKDGSNGKEEMWPALYEKAFAQLATQHPDVLQGDGDTGSGYNPIGGGGTSEQALAAITGQSSTTYMSPAFGGSGWTPEDNNGNATGDSQNISNILESANAGDVVTSGSLDKTDFSAMQGYDKKTNSVKFSDGSTLSEDSNQMLQLKSSTGSLTSIVAGHQYSVLGMDPENGNVILRNPWGSNPDTSKPYDPNNPLKGNSSSTGTFELSMADYQKLFGSVTEMPSGSSDTMGASGGGL